eukprot:scaffold3955_cov160-Cylindrotheca_fusiformis.AAC.7
MGTADHVVGVWHPLTFFPEVNVTCIYVCGNGAILAVPTYEIVYFLDHLGRQACHESVLGTSPPTHSVVESVAILEIAVG